jgi:hypothetical protein
LKLFVEEMWIDIGRGVTKSIILHTFDDIFFYQNSKALLC